jgi:hypothetical protein
MSSAGRQSDEFQELLDRFALDELTPDAVARLEELAAADPDACDLYIRWAFVRAGLRSHAAEVADLPPPDPQPAARSFVLLGNGLSAATANLLQGWPVAYLIATVILGLGLMIGAVTHVSQPDQFAEKTLPSPSGRGAGGEGDLTADNVPSPVVGRITGMVDCRWLEKPKSEIRNPKQIGNPKSQIRNLNSPVSLGDRLAILSGLLEITYDTGVRVILQGPVTYEVESPDGGFLSLGKLTARVEKKAEGGRRKAEESNPQSLIPNPLFVVRTPTATVTDLGTEFGVEVAESGETTSHVFRGSVRVQAVAADGGGPILTQVLRENQSAVVAATTAVGVPLKIQTGRGGPYPGRFVREMPPAKSRLPIHVLAYFRLGEDDPGNQAGGPTAPTTINAKYPWHLTKHGSSSYVGDTHVPNSSLHIDFPGADGDYFYSDAFCWTPIDNFVLEAWVRANRIGETHMYVAYNGNSDRDGYGLLVWDRKWQYLLGDVSRVDSGIPCEMGRWTHLALVCEAGKSQLWVNGRPAGQPFAAVIKEPSRSFVIGGYREEGQSHSHPFDGQIDEVRLFEFRGLFLPEMLLFPTEKNPSNAHKSSATLRGVDSDNTGTETDASDVALD